MVVRVLLRPGVLVRVLPIIVRVLMFVRMNVFVRMAMLDAFMNVLMFMLMGMFVRVFHMSSFRKNGNTPAVPIQGGAVLGPIDTLSLVCRPYWPASAGKDIGKSP